MDKPIKVLQVIPQLGPSGISSVVLNWLREIDTQCVQFDFICFNDGQYREELESKGCRVFCIPTFRQSPLAHIKAVKEILLSPDGKYDVIHVHNSFKNFVMLSLAKKYKVPVRVCHSHTAGLELSWLAPAFSLIKSLTKRFSNQYVACGEKAGQFLFGDAPFIVLNNAIKVEKFLPSQNLADPVAEVIDKYHLPKDKKLVLHVGRFSEVKNHQFFLTLAISKQLDPDLHFVCIGDGPLKESFAQDIIETRQQHRFSLLPANNDIPLLLHAAQAFVMPSLFEGVSVAMLEAQAAKLPCFVSDTISLEADMGLSLVEFLSLERPDDCIEQLNYLQEKNLEDDDVKQAFRHKNYSIDAVVGQLVDLYQEGLKAQ